MVGLSCEAKGMATTVCARRMHFSSASSIQGQGGADLDIIVSIEQHCRLSSRTQPFCIHCGLLIRRQQLRILQVWTSQVDF